MAGELLSLSHYAHNTIIVEALEDLLGSNTLVDCILTAEGKCVKAHKVVLSASSPYFQMLFSQESDKHPIVFLKDVKYQHLKMLVDFIYRGQVKISDTQLDVFLDIAKSLQIKGLDSSNRNTKPGRPKSPEVRGSNSKKPRISENDRAGLEKEQEDNDCEVINVIDVINVDDRVEEAPRHEENQGTSAEECVTYSQPSPCHLVLSTSPSPNTIFAEDNPSCAENNQLDAESNQLDAESNQLNAESNQLDAESNQLNAESNQLDAESNQLDAESNQLDVESNQMDSESNLLEDGAESYCSHSPIRSASCASVISCEMSECRAESYCSHSPIRSASCASVISCEMSECRSEECEGKDMKDDEMAFDEDFVTNEDMAVNINKFYENERNASKECSPSSSNVDAVEEDHDDPAPKDKDQPETSVTESWMLPTVKVERMTLARSITEKTNARIPGTDCLETTDDSSVGASSSVSTKNRPRNVKVAHHSQVEAASARSLNDAPQPLSAIIEPSSKLPTNTAAGPDKRSEERPSASKNILASPKGANGTIVKTRPQKTIDSPGTFASAETTDIPPEKSRLPPEKSRPSTKTNMSVARQSSGASPSKASSDLPSQVSGATSPSTQSHHIPSSCAQSPRKTSQDYVKSSSNAGMETAATSTSPFSSKDSKSKQTTNSKRASSNHHDSVLNSKNGAGGKSLKVKADSDCASVSQVQSSTTKQSSSASDTGSSQKPPKMAMVEHNAAQVSPLQSNSPIKPTRTRTLQKTHSPPASAGTLQRRSVRDSSTLRSSKKFVCTVCSRAYSKEYLLQIHAKKHSRERQFTCPDCDKSFARANSLEKHQVVHTQDKDFTCNICDKRYSTKGTLKIHMRLHTGEKPYECQKCDRTFAYKSQLWYHKNHHPNRQYCCKLCAKKFKRRQNLDKHNSEEHCNTPPGES